MLTTTRRAVPSSLPRLPHHHQVRHASLIPRPKRPYTFTQLLTLSDGSTFTHRTTSPLPLHRSTKDTRNSALWNPSSAGLVNVEEDEAGRLRRFRERFGRGFDVDTTSAGGEGEGQGQGQGVEGDEREGSRQEPEGNLLDLISGFAEKTGGGAAGAGGKKEEKVRSGKGKGGEK